MKKKVLIVGGVAGGASTAARLRRIDESSEIIMFERGKYISFANCGLPYYIGGTIKERSALLVQTPEAMKARFNIDVRVENEVVKIDRENKKVIVKDLSKNVNYEESYDVLVLSPGSSPLKPPIPGIDLPNIFSLWNIPDTDAIKSFIDNNKLKTATVIGGGFIGIEMAENLHDLGLEVSLAEMAPQVMTTVDKDMAQLIHSHLAQKGVKLYLNNGVKKFEKNENSTDVVLSDGTTINSDIVILSIGIRPNGELAKDAGLSTNSRGGIIVDEYLRTSDKNIYALGDAVEIVDFVNKKPTMIPLAGPANKQGRIVANNICGMNEKYKGTQGTSVAKVFDLTVATTGNNEKTLNKMNKEYGKDYLISIVYPKSHAGYYPGAFPMTIKLIFDLNGKVLGAQAIGIEGVDKRIDVIATSIRFGGTIYDLKELELAYAPPFSSAKDPVNMAAYVAENILTKKMNGIRAEELIDLDSNEVMIIDVREPIELELGKVDGAINIPLDELRKRINEIDKNKEIIVYCAVGLRGHVATSILNQLGYKTKNLLGGYNFYKCFIKDYNENNKSNLDCNNEVITDKREIDMKDIESKNVIELNACGLQCPGPILQLSEKMKELNDGDILKVSATDPGFIVDVQSWCNKTGNLFLGSNKTPNAFVANIQRKIVSNDNVSITNTNDSTTMVVFSGDLDKALASFIIANGAAAMGKKVTMFFTFWGLNILRKPEKIKVDKTFIEKMFGTMMPRGTNKLKLSKMNMGGMGSIMMKKVMTSKNVNTLDELINSALKNNVKLVACTMSMDVMGIKKEELISGIEFGGVASYLGEADKSNHNLFI